MSVVLVVPGKARSDKRGVEVGTVLRLHMSDCAAVAVFGLADDAYNATENEGGGELLRTSSPRLV